MCWSCDCVDDFDNDNDGDGPRCLSAVSAIANSGLDFDVDIDVDVKFWGADVDDDVGQHRSGLIVSISMLITELERSLSDIQLPYLLEDA